MACARLLCGRWMLLVGCLCSGTCRFKVFETSCHLTSRNLRCVIKKTEISVSVWPMFSVLLLTWTRAGRRLHSPSTSSFRVTGGILLGISNNSSTS